MSSAPAWAVEASELGRARRRWAYDPWIDLGGRTGVMVAVTPGRLDGTGCLGLTHFASLTIQLATYQSDWQMRSTLTHELIHLERGAVTLADRDQEEAAIELLTALRLIDPAVYRAIPTEVLARPEEDDNRALEVLGVDVPVLEAYAAWRRGVTPADAVRVWEEQRRYARIAWPPSWLAPGQAAAVSARLQESAFDNLVENRSESLSTMGVAA